MVADEAVPFGVRGLGVLRRRPGPVGSLLPIVAAGLAITVLVGCGGDGTPPAARTGRSSPSTEAGIQGAGLSPGATYSLPDLASTVTQPPATLVPVPTSPPDDLAAATSIAPLEGFSEIAAGSGLGPLDLASAAGGDAREREALSRFRFRDGYARGFAKGGEEMLVTVLRFSSPADAAAYLQDTIESSLVSNGSFLFAVPVASGTGYREQGARQDGEPYVTYGALFTRGDLCFEQLVRSPATGPERSEADAQLMARRQADRVGA